jgi:hypothetical protein
MVGVKTSSNLKEYANQITAYDNDLRYLPSPINSYRPNRPTRDSNAMDIDLIEKSYAPVGSQERERRKKEGLCFKCVSSRHISPDCKVPIPGTQIRPASLNRSGRSSSPSQTTRRIQAPGSRSSSTTSRSSNSSRVRSKGKSRE